MFIYIFILSIIVLSAIIFDIKGRTKNRKTVYKTICLIIIAVVSFSYKIGIDTNVYMEFYKQVGTLNNFKLSEINDYIFEPLYVLLNMAANSLNLDWVGFKLICTLLLNIPVFKLLWHNSKYPFSALLLYYLLYWIIMNFESMRQSCAVGFYIWACMSLMNNDTKGFLLKSVPVLLLHQTGIIIIPITFLISKIELKKWHLAIVVVFFTVSLASATFFSDLIQVFNMISADIGESYEQYVNTSNSTGLVTVRNVYGIIIPLFLKIIIPSCLCVYYLKQNRQWLARFLFLFAIFSTMQFSLAIVSRVVQYVSFFYIIGVLDYIMPQIKRKNYSLSGGLVILSIILNIYTTNINYFRSDNYFAVNGKDIRYFPYKSVLSNPKEIPSRESYQRFLYNGVYE